MTVQYLKKANALNTERISICYLLAGFMASLCLRVSVGSPNVAYSWVAGILFAACLFLISVSIGTKTVINSKVVAVGFASGLLLLIPAILANLHHTHSAGNYATWSVVVSTVAFAEEMFLRGVLFETIKKAYSQNSAIILTAIIFALLHVPLYGWHVLPLDFFVGLYLGVVRAFSGSWVAPGISHTLADLAGWWLV